MTLLDASIPNAHEHHRHLIAAANTSVSLTPVTICV